MMEIKNDTQIPWQLLRKALELELDEQEADAFAVWLSDSSHAELYAELKRLWLLLLTRPFLLDSLLLPSRCPFWLSL